MSFLIQNHAEMSLACFTPPTLKWWPSLLPLLSATVPSEVRLIDSSPLLPWCTICDLPLRRANSVATTSVFTVKPILIRHALTCGPPCGMAFAVRVSGCFIEDENECSFIPLKDRNLNISDSFFMLQEH